MKISLYTLLICNVLIASQNVAGEEMEVVATYRFSPYLPSATLDKWKDSPDITLKCLDMRCLEKKYPEGLRELATIMNFDNFLAHNRPFGIKEKVCSGLTSVAALSLLYYSVSNLLFSNSMSYKKIVGCGSIGLLLGCGVFSYLKNKREQFKLHSTLTQKYAHALSFDSNQNTMSLHGHKDLLPNVTKILSDQDNINKEIENLRKATKSAENLFSKFNNIRDFSTYLGTYSHSRNEHLYTQPN
jgi:hypothetical protein